MEEDERHCNVPNRDEYRSQRELGRILLDQWHGLKAPVSEILYLPELAAERVVAEVQWFDKYKGFGFVTVPHFRDTAFVHSRIVEQAGIGELHDSDQLICDISRNDKGLVVSVIHGLRNPFKAPPVKCEIVKLLPDRGYGFVSVANSGVDSFFHFNLFSPADKQRLVEGMVLKAEIQVDREGRSQVRRVLGILS